MKTTINRKNIIDAINVVGRIASNKSPWPILQNIKFSIRTDGFVVITAVGMDMYAMRKFKVADSFGEHVEFCINPKDFSCALKSLMDEEVELEILDNACVLTHKKGEMTFPISDSVNFPSIEIEKDAKKVRIKSNTLFEWLKNAAPFCANDNLRPALSGVRFYMKGGESGVCASDGLIMFFDSKNIDENYDMDVSCTIPVNAISTILDIINDTEYVTVYFGEKKISFRTDSSIISCSLPIGAYPNFRQIIRNESPLKVTVNKREFIESVSRVVLSSNNISSLVKINADNKSITIEAEDLKLSKKSRDELECNIVGGSIKIGFNGYNLLKSIKPIDSENLTFWFKDERTSVVITDEDSYNKRVIVIPTKLN